MKKAKKLAQKKVAILAASTLAISTALPVGMLPSEAFASTEYDGFIASVKAGNAIDTAALDAALADGKITQGEYDEIIALMRGGVETAPEQPVVENPAVEEDEPPADEESPEIQVPADEDEEDSISEPEEAQSPETSEDETPSTDDSEEEDAEASDEAPSTSGDEADSESPKEDSTSSDEAPASDEATGEIVNAQDEQELILKEEPVGVPQEPQLSVSSYRNAIAHYNNSDYAPVRYSQNLETARFIALIGSTAQRTAHDHDLYASVMIAQAIVESGSGNSALSGHPFYNLFGIKGTYNGHSIKLPTLEHDENDEPYLIDADFRIYDSYAESIEDYANLLTNSMSEYYNGVKRSETEDYKEACQYLRGRYCTDQKYPEKLMDIIETYDLTRFDVPPTTQMREAIVMPSLDDNGEPIYIHPRTEAYDEIVEAYEQYKVDRKAAEAKLIERQKANPDAELPLKIRQGEKLYADYDKLIDAHASLPKREIRHADDLITLASSFLGLGYVWGGTTPAGFDCSGLIQYCYDEALDIPLSRTTYTQQYEGTEITFDELMPGDLLFFDRDGDVHHVAMYIGDGFYIHSPQTGDVVKVTAMEEYMPDFAKRIVSIEAVAPEDYDEEDMDAFGDRIKLLYEQHEGCDGNSEDKHTKEIKELSAILKKAREAHQSTEKSDK